MNGIDVNRAQYDARDHREDYRLSTRFRFEVELSEDAGEFVHKITCTRKVNGTLVGVQYAHSVEEVGEVISGWWAQLSVADRPLDMGANR